MNTETAAHPFPTSMDSGPTEGGLNGGERVHKVAQKLHGAVDTLEQKIGEGSDRVLTLHEEYGNLAREQVRANPLAAVGIAFAAGYVVAKVFGR